MCRTSTRRSKDKIQESSDYLFWLSIGHRVMDQRSGDGRFIGWIKNRRDQFLGRIFQISKCWTRRLLLLWTKSSCIPSSRRRSASRSKPKKEDQFPRGRQIAFMIYEYFRVTDAHDTVYIQEFDTRWDEVLLSMTKIPSDDVLESLYKLRMRESAQLKTVWELYDMEIHQKISMPNCQKLKTMVKRSTN